MALLVEKPVQMPEKAAVTGGPWVQRIFFICSPSSLNSPRINRKQHYATNRVIRPSCLEWCRREKNSRVVPLPCSSVCPPYGHGLWWSTASWFASLPRVSYNNKLFIFRFPDMSNFFWKKGSKKSILPHEWDRDGFWFRVDDYSSSSNFTPRSARIFSVMLFGTAE